MNFSVTILGSNSATPLLDRHPTSQIVNHLNRYFMVDCGEGTQVQLARFKVKMNRINHIFITHLHGDHYFGLTGLLMTYHLFGRQVPVTVYGPRMLEEITLLQLKASKTTLAYPLHFVTYDPDLHQMIYEDDFLEVLTIPMNHSIPTCGFLFREKLREQNMIDGVIEKYGIPWDAVSAIKKGDGYLSPSGIYYPNRDLAHPPAPPRMYACCSDTALHEPVTDIIRGADLLYHEATFTHDRVAVAHEKLHSTAFEAALLARQARVSKLIIGHYSARYDKLEPLLHEARITFPETYLATEGSVFEVGR